MPLVVIASTFYTASLENHFEKALARDGQADSVSCVPYNQLQSFLLNPRSVIPENTPSIVILLLRIEDFIRLDLASLGGITTGAEATCLRLLRERELQFLDVLSGMSQLRLTLMICPGGVGAYDTKFLGNATRITEHKIAAEIRSQRRHLVVNWPDFEKAKPGSWASPTADRLGHVPFTPAGLDAIADFFVSQIDKLPTSTLEADAEGKDALTLERFLGSLHVEVSIAPLRREEEQTARNLVRHTTHFINVMGGKWDAALAVATLETECWIVRVTDRFGDYGVSGGVAFAIHSGKMLVDFLFLTCPVLGKQVEHTFFIWLADVAEQRDASTIEIPLSPGRDNKILSDVLTRFSSDFSSGQGVNLPAANERHFVLNVQGLKERILQEAPNQEALHAILSDAKVIEVASH